jgi:hypothetical protein
MADPYLDIVAPILQSRCASCHSEDNREADLDLTSHEGIRRGGETGGTVVAGRPEVSEMIRRVTLPPSDEAYLPAEGKTPLTDDQVSILEWWIVSGAETNATIGELVLTRDAQTRDLLAAELGIGG